MENNKHAVQNVSTFQVPILATRNGRAVRILAVGDKEGSSPVYLYVAEDGTSQWESLNEFRIIDPSALPCSTEAFTKTLQDSTRKQ